MGGMKEKLLLEREGSRIALPEREGDKYKVRIIGWEPGAEYSEGSSGDYPVKMLKEDVPLAFPKGTRMRANHDGLCENGGDIRRIMAKTVDTPWEESDGMYTYAKAGSKQHEEFLDAYADVIGVSISAYGEYQKEENEDGDFEIVTREETGNPVIKHLFSMEESPYNSIDFVEAPGADGRIVAKIVQEARKTILEGFTLREAATFAKGTIKTLDENDSPAVPPRKTKEGKSMDEETRQAIEEAAGKAATQAVEAFAAANAPAPVETQGEDVAEAAFKAGLSEGGRKAVYARVKNGEAVESAVAAEKARETEIEESVKARLATQPVFEQSGVVSGFDSNDISESGYKDVDDADWNALVGGVN